MRQAPKPWEEAYRRQGRLWRGERLDTATRALLEQRPALRRVRWLDAGCGDGKGLAPLAAALDADAPSPIGADLARWGLRQAKAGAPAHIPLVQADARAWPFAEAVFGAVRAVHLLGHLEAVERNAATQALARLMRPGGVLLVAEFGRGDFRHGMGTTTEPHTFRRGTGITTHYFDRAELEALLLGADLNILRLDAERFTVRYEGVERARERWVAVAERPGKT